MTGAEVCCARTLDEIRAIEAKHEARGPNSCIARLLVGAWVLAANSVVIALKLCLFRWRALPREQVHNIVTYAVGTLGDNVVTLSSLAGLKRAFPDAAITVIVNATGYDPELSRKFFEGVHWLDRVIVIRDDPVKRKGLSIVVTYSIADRIPCDLFVDFSRFGNTGWFGAVVREIIFAKWLGAKSAIGFCINAYNRPAAAINRVKHHFVRNEPRRAAEVLREIGLTPLANAQALPRSVAALEAIYLKLGGTADGRPLFVINPGAKSKVKCWPAERFAVLAARLRREYAACVVITGTASERSLGDEILQRAGEVGINLAGQTSVQELIELLRLCTACVTNDTGTMHVSAELDKPTVAIFTTRISPSNWFPDGERVIALFSFGNESYSYKDDGDAPSECLTRIEVEDVLSALRKVLPRTAASEEKADAEPTGLSAFGPGFSVPP